MLQVIKQSVTSYQCKSFEIHWWYPTCYSLHHPSIYSAYHRMASKFCGQLIFSTTLTFKGLPLTYLVSKLYYHLVGKFGG